MEEPLPSIRTSVIFVSRNNVDALRKSLTSIASIGSDQSVEVIVVDNASRDGSSVIDQEFPFIRMLRMQRNFGWTRAANAGIRTAQGEYLCFTQPGIEFEPETISRLEVSLSEDSTALAVCPLVLDGDGKTATSVHPIPDAAFLRRFWTTGNPGDSLPIDTSADRIPVEYVMHSPLLIRRLSITGMNYLDRRYGHFWADAEICAQIRRAGKRILLVPAIHMRNIAPLPLISFPLDRRSASLSADAAIGGAAFLQKHQKGIAGMTFRLGAIFTAGLEALSFDAARIGRFTAILGGQKIDGTQSE